jgi:hypothetical protein
MMTTPDDFSALHRTETHSTHGELPALGTIDRRQRLRLWLLSLGLWMVTFGIRPFCLGFYHDDWASVLKAVGVGSPFSSARFFWIVDLFSQRPVLGVLEYCFSSICGNSAFAWQAALAMVSLGTAVSICFFCRSVLRFMNCEQPLAEFVPGLLWLSFPWTLGSTAWPIAGPTLFAVIFFALGGTFLFNEWSRGRISWFLAPSFLALSCLTYEAFYGQFIVLGAIGLVCGFNRREGLVRVASGVMLLGLTQISALAFNRYGPSLLFNQAPAKTFNAQWIAMAMDSIKKLPGTLLSSATEVKGPLVVVIVGLLFLVGLGFSRGLARYALRPVVLRALGLTVCAAMGVLMGAALFAMAGYPVEGVGLFSRTTMCLSFWLSVAGSPLLIILLMHGRKIRVAAIATLCCLIALLAAATLHRVQDWAQAWQIQQTILRNVPIAALRNTSSGAVILYVGPFRHQGVTIFESTWDLDGAMKFTYPDMAQRSFFPARDDWNTTWDGEVVNQANAGGNVNHFKANEVWLWDADRRTVVRLIPPVTLPKG